jgi:hypothetical protein
LLQLAVLIDYKPKPGSSASALAAFTAAPGASLMIPAGFRVGSKPAPGQPSLVFETSAAVRISGDNSAIALSLLSPDVELPPNTIVVIGINTGLVVNDYVLAVENQGTPGEAAHLLQIDSLFADKAGNTTTLTWTREVGGGSYFNASKQVSLYALRVKAAPFGANAPAWATLSPTLTNFNLPKDSTGKPIANYSDAPFAATNWDNPRQDLQFTLEGSLTLNRVGLGARAGETNDLLSIRLFPNPWYYAPVPGDMNELYLDAIYNDLNDTAQSPGWAVLLTGQVFEVYHVVDARTVA